MIKSISKFISIFLCLCFFSQQVGLAQVAVELNLASHLSGLRSSLAVDKFRPAHLRYLSYDSLNNSFSLLFDKGDSIKGLSFSAPAGDTLRSRASPIGEGAVPEEELKVSTQSILNYFFVGISLPNNSFWVNLRPDSPDNVIDPYLARTDAGKILLEADLQLKKDTALATSPQTAGGKVYWDKLYKKAEELFGAESITIPTLTRPWIVPGEIIIRESTDNAYIYKATLKVMLEQDYLSSGDTRRSRLSPGMGAYQFKDERLKKLNEYSSELIRETIIPRLTKDINTTKRYAPLRQVYYSLILAQWFKQKFRGLPPPKLFDTTLKGDVPGLYVSLIDKRNLTGLTSKQSWDQQTYFKAYQASFQKGEYNLKEPAYTPQGQVIRSYMSGGMDFSKINTASTPINSNRPFLGFIKPYTSSPVNALGGTAENPFGVEIKPASASSPVTSSPGGKDIELNDQVRAQTINSYLIKINDYEEVDRLANTIIRKIENEELLDDQDVEVLRGLYNKLILNNSLVTLTQKARQGDLIVAFNDPNIKFLNTEISPPETNKYIEERHKELINLFLEQGLIRSKEEGALLLDFKQEKIIIKKEDMEKQSGDALRVKLDQIAGTLSERLTEYLRYTYGEKVELKILRSYFGVSKDIKAENDDAKILADLQALQAAKMARRIHETGEDAYGVIFNQEAFDALMREADGIRREELNGELPKEEEMIAVRGRPEVDIRAEAEAGGVGAKRRLSVKKYLDIIDLFDYPKTWRGYSESGDLRSSEEKEHIVDTLKALEKIIQPRGPPESRAIEDAQAIQDALVIIRSNPKNRNITSEDTFLARATDLAGKEGSRLISGDAIGFWSRIQNNLAEAHLKYMEVINRDADTKEEVALKQSLIADDLVKRMMADKAARLSKILGGYIPEVKVNGKTLLLINQEGGDEIVFFISGKYDWSELAHKLSDPGLGVRVMASDINYNIKNPGLGAYTQIAHVAESYISTQDADSLAKALEEQGKKGAVISREIGKEGKQHWLVYHNNVKEPYDNFFTEQALPDTSLAGGRSASSAVDSNNYNGPAALFPLYNIINTVIAEEKVFDRRVVDIVQNIITSPWDSPEETGIISLPKLESFLSILQDSRKVNPRVKESLRAYLELVREIKLQENVEIVSYLAPSEMNLLAPENLREYFSKIRRIILQFPRQLSKQIRIPIQLEFEKLSPWVAGSAGIFTGMGVKVDPYSERDGEEAYYQELAHTIWHELIHKFSLSSNKEGKPILPTAVWKQIAKSAGFYGALINGKIVQIDELPNDYKKFRGISNEQWVYQEGPGDYVVYVGRNVFERLKLSPVFQKNIKLKIYGNGEYWKTTPFESVAEAGAAYIKDSDAARYKEHDSRFAAVAKILGDTLFVVKFDNDGTMRRYELFNSDGKNQKKATILNEGELERIQKLYFGQPVKTLSEALAELRPGTSVRLEKLSILPGESSVVSAGAIYEGVLISGIKKGEQVVIKIDSENTSYTGRIVDLGLEDEELRFQTSTSVYKISAVSHDIAASSAIEGLDEALVVTIRGLKARLGYKTEDTLDNLSLLPWVQAYKRYRQEGRQLEEEPLLKIEGFLNEEFPSKDIDEAVVQLEEALIRMQQAVDQNKQVEEQVLSVEEAGWVGVFIRKTKKSGMFFGGPLYLVVGSVRYNVTIDQNRELVTIFPTSVVYKNFVNSIAELSISRSFNLGQKIKIGRNEGNDYPQPSDSWLSGEHCVLQVLKDEEGRYFWQIEDKSTNGTRIGYYLEKAGLSPAEEREFKYYERYGYIIPYKNQDKIGYIIQSLFCLSKREALLWAREVVVPDLRGKPININQGLGMLYAYITAQATEDLKVHIAVSRENREIEELIRIPAEAIIEKIEELRDQGLGNKGFIGKLNDFLPESVSQWVAKNILSDNLAGDVPENTEGAQRQVEMRIMKLGSVIDKERLDATPFNEAEAMSLSRNIMDYLDGRGVKVSSGRLVYVLSRPKEGAIFSEQETEIDAQRELLSNAIADKIISERELLSLGHFYRKKTISDQIDQLIEELEKIKEMLKAKEKIIKDQQAVAMAEAEETERKAQSLVPLSAQEQAELDFFVGKGLIKRDAKEKLLLDVEINWDPEDRTQTIILEKSKSPREALMLARKAWELSGGKPGTGASASSPVNARYYIEAEEEAIKTTLDQWFGPGQNREFSRRHWESDIEMHPGGFMVNAELGGEVMGIAYIYKGQFLLSDLNQHTAYGIGHIEIADAHRKQNIGRNIIAQAIRGSKEDDTIARGQKGVIVTHPAEDSGYKEAGSRASDFFYRLGFKPIHNDYMLDLLETGDMEEYERNLYLELPPEQAERILVEANKASSPVLPVTDKSLGGIDLRALPIMTQPVLSGAGAVPLRTFADRNLWGQPLSEAERKEEWEKIENMLAAGLTPSSERLKEYLQSSRQQRDFNQEIDKVISCIADILRLEEERIASTDSGLKEVLVLLESDKSAEQVQLALSQITIEPKEPKVVEY
ncbi:MAG: GNAT family N-acetyltransferase [Candidatus Omnitrophota bacterium]|nr:FHA domain-containing protein [Candidatus Omnitrophota bacterium]MBU1928254.1 FHA domain-containing protein [Candidatus Omnitrophota bacterium]MBU2034770.1 FHA domain-containing protein [Candidatus Omnitrophota bacterium]